MMTGGSVISFQAVADSALLVEFENEISETTHENVLTLMQVLEQSGIEGIREVVSGYRALLVYYDPITLDYDTLCAAVKPLAMRTDRPRRAGRHWQLPVLYGGQAAYDLHRIAKRSGLSEAEVIRIHSQGVYRVYMVGFAPGWTFLGGLDPRLFTPRLETPRLEVPAGCVSIGGQQTLVGGPAMPSGWNLIGQTPERTFSTQRDEEFLLAAGDRVSFRPIEREEFDALAVAATEGQIVSRELES